MYAASLLGVHLGHGHRLFLSHSWSEPCGAHALHVHRAQAKPTVGEAVAKAALLSPPKAGNTL